MAETLHATWTRLVTHRPDAVAVVEAATSRVWTRAGLHAEIEARQSKLPRDISGRRVVFALPNGAAWLAVFTSLLRAGAVPVPLDPSEPPGSRRQLAADAGAAFLLENEMFVPVADAQPLRPSTKDCLVKLTSGSTGRPKALAFTHAQMLADGRQVCATMGIAPDDLNLAVIPLGHSYGLGNLVVPLLAQGNPLVCAGVPLPQALAADIARWRPTVFPAVPALLRALAQADLPADALAPLRLVISAGTALPAETARAFAEKFNLRPHSFYGSSETGGIAYDRTGDATLAGRAVGAPLEGVRVEPIRGGRIRVTSPAVCGRGSFSPADLVTLNEHGELVLRGRAGRLVKIAGRRLDLADLERMLRELPGIADAHVAPHPANPDELAAVLATALSPADVRALLRGAMATWKIPRRIVVVAEFPLTARGKPDARALGKLLVS